MEITKEIIKILFLCFIVAYYNTTHSEYGVGINTIITILITAITLYVTETINTGGKK